MNRSYKLIAAVLVMVLTVFLFVGCGGSDDENNAPPKKSSTSSKTTSSLPPVDLPENLIGQLVKPTSNSPSDFSTAIADHQPIVVTFYMPAPDDDSKVRSSIMNLQGQYNGQVEFFSYLYSDSQSYQDLSALLMVNATPTVVVINRQGVVQRAWTGYVDEKSIEQGIVEALGFPAD